MRYLSVPSDQLSLRNDLSLGLYTSSSKQIQFNSVSAPSSNYPSISLFSSNASTTAQNRKKGSYLQISMIWRPRSVLRVKMRMNRPQLARSHSLLPESCSYHSKSAEVQKFSLIYSSGGLSAPDKLAAYRHHPRMYILASCIAMYIASLS